MAEIEITKDNPHFGQPPEELTNALYIAKEDLKRANAVVASIEENKRMIETALVYYHQQNPPVKMIGTDMAKAAFSEETVYNCVDWDAAFEFITEHNAVFLLQRRLNNAPLRDMQNMGQLPAFVSPYTRVKVGCTKAPAKKR